MIFAEKILESRSWNSLKVIGLICIALPME